MKDCVHPDQLYGAQSKFDGIISWGVLHHVAKEQWLSYLESFSALLDKKGILLLGGHSSLSKDFSDGFRISPTTSLHSYSIDGLLPFIENSSFILLEKDTFSFQEGYTGNTRHFTYYLLEKKEGKILPKNYYK